MKHVWIPILLAAVGVGTLVLGAAPTTRRFADLPKGTIIFTRQPPNAFGYEIFDKSLVNGKWVYRATKLSAFGGAGENATINEDDITRAELSATPGVVKSAPPAADKNPYSTVPAGGGGISQRDPTKVFETSPFPVALGACPNGCALYVNNTNPTSLAGARVVVNYPAGTRFSVRQRLPDGWLLVDALGGAPAVGFLRSESFTEDRRA